MEPSTGSVSFNHPLKSINNASSNRNNTSPLDFSFRRLKDISTIMDDEQASLTTPVDNNNEDNLTPTDHTSATTTVAEETTDYSDPAKTGDFPKPTHRRHKSRSKCLRLNNNSLTSVDGLTNIISFLFQHPMYLSWLDFSFNRLTEISTVFCDLPYLQILYLHGNCIAELSQVENLRAATRLKKLTLHGNPIENVKDYRNSVLTTIPSLNEFDFSCVVKSDRTNAEVWCKNHQNLMARKRNAKRKKAQLENGV